MSGLLLNPHRFGVSHAITFVAGTSAAIGNATTIAANAPAGVTTGDGLFAYFMHRSTATPPAGSTLVVSNTVNGT